MHQMDINNDSQVDMEEFTGFMESVLAGVPDKVVERRICSLLESRVAGCFQYDFSGMYCGYRGAQAIIKALSSDTTFESVDLSGCGLDNNGTQELASILASHPVCWFFQSAHNKAVLCGGLCLAARARAFASAGATWISTWVLECLGSRIAQRLSASHAAAVQQHIACRFCCTQALLRAVWDSHQAVCNVKW
jgi:hypothetical protein